MRRSVVVACCVFGWVVAVAGQGAGILTGTVSDDTGRVLPGATVVVETDEGSVSADAAKRVSPDSRASEASAFKRGAGIGIL